jgi:hypothetical protein
MNNSFAIHAPLNSLSISQTVVPILFELYHRGFQPNLFPIGQTNLSCYHYLTEDFKKWLESCVRKANREHRRAYPTLKIWHLMDSLGGFSYKQALMTYHECDTITETEQNIIRNNDTVIVTSDYTKGVFDGFGATNVVNVPLGFDSNSFKPLNKKYYAENVIVFGLTGKLEHRKRHLDVLKYWAEKFGNKHEYVLNCCIYNQFLSPEIHQNILSQALQGKQYWNINFNPFLDRNDAFNDYLNSNNILLGMSSAEGWGLPEFQSVAIGKHAVVLNATGYKEWATDENCILVNPSGKADIYDGMFFQKGLDFNQGQSYTWSKESFLEGVDKAIARVKSNKVNEAGKKLVDLFTYKNTVDKLLAVIEGLV